MSEETQVSMAMIGWPLAKKIASGEHLNDRYPYMPWIAQQATQGAVT